MMIQGPRIPQEEYSIRWNKVQELLIRYKLDALIAYADDRATYGPAYARYFADFPVHFEPVLLLFTLNAEPKLLCGPETIGYAQEVSRIHDIRVLEEFAAENEDYLFTTLNRLDAVIGESIHSPMKRLGLAGVHLMGADIFTIMLKVFQGVEIVRMENEMDNLRGIKTEAELAVIRHCYEIAHLGMTAAIDAVVPGVSEREIAAKAEFAMRSAGSEGTGIDTIVASGSNTYHILARTTFRKVEKDDVVVITVAPRYEGYHGAIARSVIVGNPGEKVIASIEAEVNAQLVCSENLIAGKKGADVERMGRSIMADAGYGENFLYSGLHSVGVTEFEPPILGPSSDALIENGMVISIDIPLFEAGIHGSRTEDGYIIKNGKAERLTRIERLIRK